MHSGYQLNVSAITLQMLGFVWPLCTSVAVLVQWQTSMTVSVSIALWCGGGLHSTECSLVLCFFCIDAAAISVE